MSNVYIPTRFQLRKDTAANWAANNPTPLDGEPCLETDTGIEKVGDGVTPYNDLLCSRAGLIDLTGLADGDTLVWDATAGVFKPGTGSGGGGMTLVGTATVSGSAATSLTLTGLDLGADGGVYRVVYALTNATASASDISLYFSGDTTATNYYTQQILANGSTISANTGRTNTAKVIGMNLSTSAVGAADIVLDGLGYIRGVVTCARDQTTGMLLQMAAIQHKTTGNLTSLTFTAAVAGALAVGSYFKVLKVG